MKPGFYGSNRFNDIVFLLRNNEGYQIGNGHNEPGHYSSSWSNSFTDKRQPTNELLTKLKQITPKTDVNLQVINTFINKHTLYTLSINNLIVHIHNRIIFNILDVVFIEQTMFDITLHFKETSITIFLNEENIKKIVNLYIDKKSKVGHL